MPSPGLVERDKAVAIQIGGVGIVNELKLHRRLFGLLGGVERLLMLMLLEFVRGGADQKTAADSQLAANQIV